MGYWKSKVLPKIKKVFEKGSTTKKAAAAAAAESSKSFDESKEEYNKAFEEKKTELLTKVVEIYEASSTEIKGLVKERNEEGLKKNSTAVNKFLEELVKIDFPGSKAASDLSSKFGPALASGPVFYVLEKVSTLIVTEEIAEGPPAESKTEEETSSVVKEREIVAEEVKKEEKKPHVVETSSEKKVEEQPAEPASQEEEKPAEPAAVVEQAEPPKP